MKTLHFLAAVLSSFALVGQSPGEEPSADETEMRAAVTRYVDAYNSSDTEALGELWTDGAVYANHEIEGMADKTSQRAAWTVKGKTRPIMETGIANLTEDIAPVLVHFADGSTQQWLMVHLEEPMAK